MKLTNRYNLPAALVRAVANDEYNPGDCDITVTQLIDPPRKVALTKAHYAEMEEDASDRIWALIGQAAHEILRRSNTAESADIVETRLYATINDWKVSGQIDLWSAENAIVDYKITSSWTVLRGVKREWIEQLNCLAHLARLNGTKIEKLEVVAIFRDWSKLEAARNADYPQAQVMVFAIPLWGHDETAHWMAGMVRLHQVARGGFLLNCTSEERWEKPAKYAVMKKGQQKALRVLDSRAMALDFIRAGKGDTIQFRPGESVRCAHYCSAAPFCDQWKEIQKQEVE